MSQIYFVGDSSSKGVYYFYSTQSQGWVVADLDIGKSYLCNSLVTLRVVDEGASKKNPITALEKKFGLGQDEEKWLIDGDDLVAWLSNFDASTEVLMFFDRDGDCFPYRGSATEVVTTQLVELAKKAQKHFKE